MPTIFITAAAGHIGSKLVPLLLTHPDYNLVLPTRDASKFESLYSQSKQVTIVEGSIQDPQWVEAQIKAYSCTSIFICLTATDELFTTLNIFSAIKRSPTIKQVIYLSACADFFDNGVASTGGFLCAHALVKLPIELALKELEKGRIKYTILGPSLFFTNDLRMKGGIVGKGVYGEGVGQIGASRVSTSDIARSVEVLIGDKGTKWGGKKIMLGSLKKYTEDDISRIWTEALDKPVICAPVDEKSLDVSFEPYMREGLGPAWARDLRLMYEGFRDCGFGPNEEQYKTQLELLGREPEVYEEFVAGVAKEWRQEA